MSGIRSRMHSQLDLWISFSAVCRGLGLARVEREMRPLDLIDDLHSGGRDRRMKDPRPIRNPRLLSEILTGRSIIII